MAISGGVSGEDPTAVPELKNEVLAVIEAVVKVAKTIGKLKTGDDDDDVAVPEEFLCPITNVLMRDPVIVTSGQTFDRSAIEKSLKEGKLVCPKTGINLYNTGVTPNHLVRDMISKWCKKHGQPEPVEHSISTASVYIDKDKFTQLHMNLSSASIVNKKEAAKELREVTIDRPYFRVIYDKSPDTVSQLLTLLSRSDKDNEIDPHLQEDLITTLMIVSNYEKVKKVIAESPIGIPVLIEAMQSENIETQRNAVSTIFQLSSLDSNKQIIGETNAFMILIRLLSAQRGALFLKDVALVLVRLCENAENKARLVKTHGVPSAFEKLKSNECVDIILQLLASLSTVEEGVSELESYSYYDHHLFRVMRESVSAANKENGIAILYNVFIKNGLSWQEKIREEEVENGTISEIAQNGTQKAKNMADLILEYIALASKS